MADYLIKDTTLKSIAQAIRDKKGYPSTTTFTPAQMASEIESITTSSGEIVQGAQTITPSKSQQIVPTTGYTAVRKVTVNPIPPEYIIPSETLSITSNENGIDVKKYAYVNVAVPASGGGSTDNSKLLQILARSVTELTANDLAECANIAKYALSYCSLLTDVTIPNTVTFIGDYAFYQCSSLANLSIGSGVTYIGDNAFTNCDGLTSVTIPNSVNKIVKSAFRQCDNLNRVVIGSGVTSIGDQAFYYCPLLESVTVNATTPPTLSGTMVFTGCSEKLKIYVPSASLNAYKGASNWSNYQEKMEGI